MHSPPDHIFRACYHTSHNYRKTKQEKLDTVTSKRCRLQWILTVPSYRALCFCVCLRVSRGLLNPEPSLWPGSGGSQTDRGCPWSNEWNTFLLYHINNAAKLAAAWQQPGASISSLSSWLLITRNNSPELKIILSINHDAGNQAPSAFLIILKIFSFSSCWRKEKRNKIESILEITQQLAFTHRGHFEILMADEAETPVVCWIWTFFIFLIYFPQSPGAGSINIYNLVELIHSHKPMTATEDWFLNSSNI